MPTLDEIKETISSIMRANNFKFGFEAEDRIAYGNGWGEWELNMVLIQTNGRIKFQRSLAGDSIYHDKIKEDKFTDLADLKQKIEFFVANYQNNFYS